MSLVAVRGVVKAYGSHRALDGVDFAVAERETVAVVGPSGSGKTTLLRMIAGLEAPDSGEVHVGGRLASGPGRVIVPPHQRRIGFVFQSSALWPHMTAAQNIAFALHGVPRDTVRARVAALLQQVGLAGMADRYPDQQSGGEARRVALARALAADPELLLMDEPLTNLDLERKSQLLDLIVSSAAASGASLVYVTHDAAEARAVARRVVAMCEGRVVGSESPGG